MKSTGVKEKDVRTMTILLLVLAVTVGVAYGLRGGAFDPFTGDGGEGGDVEGYTSLSVTFHYTDGSSSTYEPEGSPLEALGVLPLTVTSPTDHKEIDRITYDVKVKATWTGTMTTYDFTSSDVGVALRLGDKFTSPKVVNPGAFRSGEYAVVASGVVYGTDVDAMAYEYFEREGELFVDVTADIVLVAKFKDGSTDTKTGSASGSVKVLWEPDAPSGSALTSISVQIDRQRLT